MRCRRGKPRRVPSGREVGVDPPACPEGAREAKRGRAGYRRIPARGAKGNTGSRRIGRRERSSQQGATLRTSNLCKPAQPHEGQSDAGDGDLLARADPDRRRSDSEP